MIKKYDYENQTMTYKCGNCSHTYTEDVCSHIPNDDRFIELGKTTITKNKYSYYERLEEAQLYACPKCGCVQIEL